MNNRQLAYRRFLQTRFWKELSKKKRELVLACENCGSPDKLQCHHKEYPKRWEDTTLEQLIVLCRTCHRIEHGLVVFLPFDWKLRDLKSKLAQYDGNLKSRPVHFPSELELQELASMIVDKGHKDEAEAFLRQVATSRIIRWDSWLSKGRDITIRLWPWATKRLKQLKKHKRHLTNPNHCQAEK